MKRTRKTWKVIQILKDGREIVLESYRDQERAELKASAYNREEEYEISIGYKPTGVRYEARYA